MLKIILIVEAIGKPDKRRHHRFVSFASVRLNGIVCFAKGKMHCFATLDKAELRRSIKRRQTASVFPVVVERHNTTQNEKGEKMKTTLSYGIIPETGKVSSGLGGRIRLKPDRICRITPLLWKRRRDKIGVFTIWIAQNAIVKNI